MHINNLIGIPYLKGGTTIQGADCWGIALLAMREVYGVVIDCYLGSKASGEALGNLVDGAMQNPKFKEIAKPENPCFVVMCCRTTSRPEHIGLHVGDGLVLSSLSMQTTSSIHKLITLKRYFKEIRFFKYNG